MRMQYYGSIGAEDYLIHLYCIQQSALYIKHIGTPIDFLYSAMDETRAPFPDLYYFKKCCQTLCFVMD